VRDPTTQAVLGQYTYDAFGRRVRKITAAGTQLFFYDAAGQLLEEGSLATSPHTVRDYVWIEAEPVGTVDSGPQPTKVAWVHTDRLGTPLAVTSSPAAGNAATIWRASYAPFGLATVNEDPDGDLQVFAMELRFPGQRWDAEAWLHYNFARDYEPATGRYLVLDPLGPVAGLNSYRYANGDGVNWIDRDGLAPFFNNTNHSVVVSGGTGSGRGHAGPTRQVTVPAGQSVSASSPLEGISDVDAVDFNGDGIAEVPDSLADLFPAGEKIVGGDTGPECSVVDNPFADLKSPFAKWFGPEKFSIGPKLIPYPSGWK
jgi:RHS repeat-associated protein